MIAEVDPVAPLLDQLGVLEDLIAAYPEYGDIITEQMLRVQEEIDKANDGLKEQKDDVEKLSPPGRSLARHSLAPSRMRSWKAKSSQM